MIMVEPDCSLVARAQQGDRRAFETLVQRHRRRIYSLAYRMTFCHEDADDILQEAFLRAYRKLDSFDTRLPFANWLYTIALNLCLDRQRRRQRQHNVSWNQVEDLDLSWADPGSPEPTPHNAAANGELRDHLYRAINRLPERQRAAVVLFEVEGLRITEVARLMNCSEGAVKSTLHRARRRLREDLRDYIEVR